MSYEQLAASVDALAVANNTLTAAVTNAQAVSDANVAAAQASATAAADSATEAQSSIATLTGLSSVAALRDISTVLFNRAETLGYSAMGDGGQGKYYFVLTGSPPADNGVTVIRSNDGRGYWSLMHSGTLDVKQAGAGAGIDCFSAFTKVAAAVVASNGAISRVVFSPVAGGQYTVASQVLFNCSQITYEFFANVVNTSNSYITPIVFSHDLAAQPLAALFNVTLIGNGFKFDANGAAILAAMGLGPGVLPSTFPQAMFNYIDNLKVHEVDFANGVFDSCAARQCRNHKFTKCTFRDATQYLANGLNITTNWATYVRGDYSTYSHGVVEDCLFYNNASMGGTYYHCCGGTFRRGISYNNGFNNGSGGSGSGFSYEMPPGAFSIKYADGLFDACHANNNGINGYYINTPGVIVNAACTSWGNGTLGLANDVSGLQMCGVMVSSADEVTVLGSHRGNARHGVSFLGATGLKPTWNCGGEYHDNAGSAINIQGIYHGGISRGTKMYRNGRILVGGQYLPTISVSNSTYNNGDGAFTAIGLEFDSNGARDINVGNVKTVTVAECINLNTNDMRTTTGGTGYNFGAIAVLILHDNFLDVVGNGWTTNGYVIGNDVTKCYQYNNKSNQVTGTVILNSASTKLGVSGAARITTGTHTVLTTLPATGTATLADVSDVLATLVESLKDGIMQG